MVDAMNARKDLGGRLSSNIVAEELGGARVVKAFNQLPAAVLGRDPSENGGRRVVFVSSNDDGASGIVQTLAKELGFSPIGLGKISDGPASQRKTLARGLPMVALEKEAHCWDRLVS